MKRNTCESYLIYSSVLLNSSQNHLLTAVGHISFVIKSLLRKTFFFISGTENKGFKYGYFCTYQIFLIVWITFGLGYIVMLLGFITSGMRSERIHKIEQKFAYQFKTTQNKILQGFTRDLSALRKIINEANLIKIKVTYNYFA